MHHNHSKLYLLSQGVEQDRHTFIPWRRHQIIEEVVMHGRTRSFQVKLESIATQCRVGYLSMAYCNPHNRRLAERWEEESTFHTTAGTA